MPFITVLGRLRQEDGETILGYITIVFLKTYKLKQSSYTNKYLGAVKINTRMVRVLVSLPIRYLNLIVLLGLCHICSAVLGKNCLGKTRIIRTVTSSNVTESIWTTGLSYKVEGGSVSYFCKVCFLSTATQLIGMQKYSTSSLCPSMLVFKGSFYPGCSCGLETDIMDPVKFHAVFVFEEDETSSEVSVHLTPLPHFFFLDTGSKSLAQAGLEFCMQPRLVYNSPATASLMLDLQSLAIMSGKTTIVNCVIFS